MALVKNPPVDAGDARPGFHPWIGRPPEEAMATHSSVLAWRIPGTEEPGGLQSMGSQSWTHTGPYYGPRTTPIVDLLSTSFSLYNNPAKLIVINILTKA